MIPIIEYIAQPVKLVGRTSHASMPFDKLKINQTVLAYSGFPQKQDKLLRCGAIFCDMLTLPRNFFISMVCGSQTKYEYNMQINIT